MAIKRKGVLAVPGEYKYGEVTETKTAEELKLAAERQPIIMITKGHPMDGIPRAKDVIGTVSQKWDEKNERVIGEFWFHDEKISDSLRKKLLNNERIPISSGILLDDIEEGIQKGIVYTHLAVLEGEDPVCPLDTCGINLRTESNPDSRIRFEMKTELDAPESEETPETEEVVEEVLDEVVEETLPVEEIPKLEEPAEENLEVEDEPEPEEEVKLVPETVIPVGRETVPKEWEVDERGYYVWTPKKYKKENR